jgi:hypothetical protein
MVTVSFYSLENLCGNFLNMLMLYFEQRETHAGTRFLEGNHHG